jgi:hypothetical protein
MGSRLPSVTPVANQAQSLTAPNQAAQAPQAPPPVPELPKHKCRYCQKPMKDIESCIKHEMNHLPKDTRVKRAKMGVPITVKDEDGDDQSSDDDADADVKNDEPKSKKVKIEANPIAPASEQESPSTTSGDGHKTYTCKHCAAPFTSKPARRRHEMKHEATGAVKRESTDQDGQEERGAKEKEEIVGEEHLCTACGFTFKKLQGLKIHEIRYCQKKMAANRNAQAVSAYN